MFQTNVVEKNQNTHFVFNKSFPPESCRLWDNVEKHGRPTHVADDNTLLRMRFACWVSKTTNTQSEYVVITALPQRNWCPEYASVWRLYLRCLSCIYLFKV